jgi:hypothetical protein
VDKLTMLFNCLGWNNIVGTTVDPNVPSGISKMFAFDFFIFNFFYYVMGAFFLFFY